MTPPLEDTGAGAGAGLCLRSRVCRLRARMPIAQEEEMEQTTKTCTPKYLSTRAEAKAYIQQFK